MAPNGETLVNSYSRDTKSCSKPRRLSMESLQRAISDLSFELSKERAGEAKLAPISEVEDAKCECCGMSEECTQEYIRKIRDKFLGKWICGLCSEAVKEERQKGVGLEEALTAHMNVCVRFNRIGRAYPALYHADAMCEILKKSNRDARRSKSTSPRDMASRKAAITRSTSCIPAITRAMSDCSTVG